MDVERRTKGQEIFRAAKLGRQKIGEVIDRGEAGAEVRVPILTATGILGIRRATIEHLGETGQMLGISVMGEQVVFQLLAGQRKIKAAYNELYLVLQGLSGSGEETEILLQRRPLSAILGEVVPEVKSCEGIMASGGYLPPEDVGGLHAVLWGLYLSLANKSGLKRPDMVF